MSNSTKDTLAKAANAVHRTLFNVSGGKIGGQLANMPALKLTTTGRKSGKPRTVMLTSPVQEGDDVILVASYGGDDQHPAWYLNLAANPTVTIEMADRRFEAAARTADAAERDRLWAKITADYQNYADYQTKTDREIPVVICSPTA